MQDREVLLLIWILVQWWHITSTHYHSLNNTQGYNKWDIYKGIDLDDIWFKVNPMRISDKRFFAKSRSAKIRVPKIQRALKYNNKHFKETYFLWVISLQTEFQTLLPSIFFYLLKHIVFTNFWHPYKRLFDTFRFTELKR